MKRVADKCINDKRHQWLSYDPYRWCSHCGVLGMYDLNTNTVEVLRRPYITNQMRKRQNRNPLLCVNQQPDSSYLCTRPVGHGGYHIANGADGKYLSSWS